MEMKTFKIGGIHPADNKFSANVAIETLRQLPSRVVIPLSQHIGAPATPIVGKGDKVKVGTLIAKSSGFVSANIHSSVSGTVVKIDNFEDAFGVRKPAIEIEVEGDEWEETIDKNAKIDRTFNLSSEEIIEKITEAGIVGMGGATFPTQVKLMPPAGKKADTLIINAVECEPYLTSDHRLMLEKGKEIMIGIQLLMKATKVNRVIIGIESNKPDAIELMTTLSSRTMSVEVCPLKLKYPQGSEKQLIVATTGRELPSGQLPIDVGVIVQNVGTAYAVFEAIVKNKPLVERVVTVTGKSLKQTKNLLVRVGTPMQFVLDSVGGLPIDTGKVVAGGPMMGKAVSNLNAPVTKGTSGILVMNNKESKREEMENCIRCGKCVEVCCMGLQPYLMMKLAEKAMWKEAEEEAIYDCLECGSCSYICPSHRPLLDYVRFGKSKVMQIRRERNLKE